MEKEFLITETLYWKVLLNSDQQNLGKSIFILKSGKRQLSDLSKDEWREFSDLVTKFEKIIDKLFDPSHFNWVCLMNSSFVDESSLKSSVHWHVAPRYPNEVDTCGHVFTDDNYPKTNKVPIYLSDLTMVNLLGLIKQA